MESFIFTEYASVTTLATQLELNFVGPNASPQVILVNGRTTKMKTKNLIYFYDLISVIMLLLTFIFIYY